VQGMLKYSILSAKCSGTEGHTPSKEPLSRMNLSSCEHGILSRCISNMPLETTIISFIEVANCLKRETTGPALVVEVFEMRDLTIGGGTVAMIIGSEMRIV
jgi:hypothetical protein